ncbi:MULTISPECIES: hypothetical protein [Pseudomonas aeruginosa group]|uniref:Membrane protein n=1 Tax=Pseudomonas paraeruginosa TaxID=2994495 RepID=A0A2R3J1Q0_9PSED|nr:MULTISPECIES: hypothetical protein [Pseudomonas aeruginosa group]AVK08098.1 putative membrane protein [Pseudomonas paraeruginosa]AWE89773.1 putative membrane protein [Pseudomonas paraeruginosa]KAB0752264.1 hypothetical protein F7O94_01905 [Pseudomonas aeruginosa]KSD60267.1 hypothetical protein AO903_31220 [Pseudomonas aeruginosa]MBG4066667.1 hypothetical protein [Pseudomonas aeruginosa]
MKSLWVYLQGGGKKNVLLWVGVLCAVVWGLYGRALFFGYVWDDSILFLDKTDLLNSSISWKVLSEPVLPGTSYLRPLVFLSFFVEFQIFGQSPFVSHAVNIAIFNLNVLLVFWLGSTLARHTERKYGLFLAFLAALFYAMHPALIESTVWASGRFDLLTTFFILAGLVVYLADIKSTVLRAFLLCLCMAGALLSKELGIVFPVLLLCLWLAKECDCSTQRGGALLVQALFRNGWMLVALIITAFGYLVVRKHSAGGIYHSPVGLSYIADVVLGQRLPLETLKFYLLQSFLPFQSINVSHPLNEVFERSVYVLLAGQMVVLILVLTVIYQALYRRSAAAWMFFAYLVCLLPVLHIIPLTIGENLGHERFLTAPLAFLALALVFVRYDRVLSKVGLSGAPLLRVGLVAGLLWLGMAGFTIYSILPMWTSDASLWAWAYKTHPESKYARYNYLYGALRGGYVELLDEEVSRLQKKYGGLEVPEQILYAHRLISAGDSEGLNYLEGVLQVLPRFHDAENGRVALNDFKHLSSMQIGGAYAVYAEGLLMLRGDAERALKYNKIAEWYLATGEVIPLMYQRSAILYALGDYGQAARIYQDQEGLHYYMSQAVKKDMKRLVEGFCKEKGFPSDPCGELRERGVISKESEARQG